MIDAVKLAARLVRSPKAVGEEIGVKLDAAAAKKLRALGEIGVYSKKIGAPPLLSALARAARASDQEIIHEVLGLHGDTVGHVLVVRQRGRVSIGAALSWLGSIGHAWAELKGWTLRHKNARERVLKWAKSQLTLDVIATAPAARAAGGDDEAALRQAIIDAPDDDAPRLVYADWLLERGDPRGDYIRLSVELARTTDEARQEEIKALTSPLWRAHRTELAGELTPYVQYMSRGFVSTVRMTATQLAKHGDRLFRLQPGPLGLILTTPRPSPAELEKLANADGMRFVRSLRIAQPMSDGPRDELAELASGHKYDRLTSLALYHCGASAKDWRALFANLDAPALRTLYLGWNGSSPAMWEAIAANPRLGALQGIDEHSQDSVGRCGVKEASAAIARLAAKPSFEWLKLHWDAVGDAAIVPFFAPQAKASLRRLELTGTVVGDETAKAIARSPRAGTLEELRVWNSLVTIDGVLALLASQRLTSLKTLRVVEHDDEERWPRARVEKVAEAALALPKDRKLELEIPHKHELTGELAKRFKKRFGA
jgi:uncharacterized protein (TIGR02996 family)